MHHSNYYPQVWIQLMKHWCASVADCLTQILILLCCCLADVCFHGSCGFHCGAAVCRDTADGVRVRGKGVHTTENGVYSWNTCVGSHNAYGVFSTFVSFLSFFDVRLSPHCMPGRKYSLVPRPHPLMRKSSLVNQVKFLGLAYALVKV